MTAGLFILAVVLIFLYDGLPLIKKGLWRELYTMGAIIGLAAYLGIAKTLELSTPFNWLEGLLSPVGTMIFR